VNFKKIKRKAELDKNGFQMGYGAIPTPFATSSFGGQVLAEAKKLAENSKFNIIEDNCCEIGILSEAESATIMARSILDTKVFLVKVRVGPSFSLGNGQALRF